MREEEKLRRFAMTHELLELVFYVNILTFYFFLLFWCIQFKFMQFYLVLCFDGAKCSKESSEYR